MNEKNLQKRIIMVTTRLMTPRQWAKVRTVLDMSKEEVMNDADSLTAVVAWFEQGGALGDFERFLDMPTGELEAIVTGQTAEDFEAELDKVLEAETGGTDGTTV